MSRGGYVARWIEANCVYTQGRWVGKPARLLRWQKRWLIRAFEIDPETGLRKVRMALLGLPKKNGKTEFGAWLALYFLIGDGELSPLVGCAAASDEQADLVFGAAKRCVEMSPTLSVICLTFDKEITVPSIPGAKLKRLSAAAGTNDGPSYSALILDELHEWTGPKGVALWDVLTNSGGAREQAFCLQVTTAGWDRDSICYRQYAYGKQVQAGEVEDAGFLFMWAEPPDEKADHRDRAVIEAANPSFGEIVQWAFYVDQLKRKTEAVFRRYFLNQWTSGSEVWLPYGAWEGCERDRKIPAGAAVVLGFDGSFNNDSTALVAVEIGAVPHVQVVEAWEKPADKDDSWRVPVLDVEAAIRRACRTFGVREIACDPFRWARTYQVLEAEGLPVEEFPQSATRMVPATAAVYEAVVNETITHDGDPRLARHVLAAAVKEDARGRRLAKRPGKNPPKIDLAVAMVMAVSRAMWWHHNDTPDQLVLPTATTSTTTSRDDVYALKW